MRPLKQWRYAGVFAPELMVCAASVRIGPLRQAFWAVWDREARALHERTLFARTGRVALPDGALRVRDRGVEIDIELGDCAAVEVTCAHGDSWVWTRKRAGLPARGRVLVDGRELAVDGLAAIDDTRGRHERVTIWKWSTGVGETSDGTAVAWNLVEGVNDPAQGSERAIWLDGEPAEVGPVEFAPDLSNVTFAEGGELRFAAEAVRERDDNLLLLRSAYRQPFGTFSGTLPDGRELACGLGVMEEHDVRW